MENRKVNLIFGILSLFLVAGIIWGISSIMKTDDRAQGEQEQQTTEIPIETAYAAMDSTMEATTQAEITEEVTEEVTETPTEELTVEDDREAPIFLTFSSSCEIKQGDTFDIHDYIGYGDDVDRSPVLSVDGTVDTAVPGTYPLTLTLADAAGHVTKADMKVNVVSEVTHYQGGSKMEFDTFSANYKTEATVLGIDVSRWQEDIDFEQVKNAGCDFVIIRIGGYDDGSQYVDKYYKTNIRNAKAAGLLVGIYWHAEESSVQEVKNNVAYMMEILDGETLDFPIAYDWEDFSGFQNYGMNLNDLNTCFETFCDEVKSYGYDACLYSSKNFLENVWENKNQHPVWLANYTSQTTYTGEYFMWQQGNTGRIAGIGTDVDFDIWYRK